MGYWQVSRILLAIGPSSGIVDECSNNLYIGIGVGAGIASVLFVGGILGYRLYQKRKEAQYAKFHEGDSSHEAGSAREAVVELSSTAATAALSAAAPVRPRTSTLQAAAEKLQLDAGAQMAVDDFQGKWAALSVR